MSKAETPQASNRVENAMEEIDIRELLQVLRRKLWLIVLVTILGAVGGMVLTAVTDPTYESEAELLVTSGSGPSMGGELSFLMGGGGGGSDNLQNRLQVMRSPIVLVPAADNLIGQGFLEAAENLEKRLTLAIVQSTDVLRIRAVGGSAAEAQAITSAVVDSYERYSETSAQDQLLRLQNFLVGQVGRALERVEDAEVAVRDFQQRTGIIYLTSEEMKVNQHMSNLEAKYMAAEIGLEENRMRLAYTQTELARVRQEMPRSTNLAADEFVNQMRELLAGLQAQRIDYVARGLEGTPEIRQLDQRISGITSQLQEHLGRLAQESGDPRGAFAAYQELMVEEIRLQAEIMGYENQLNLLETRIDEFQEELWNLSEKAFEYARLEREVTVNNETYAMLVQELERTRIAVERETADVQLIRPATLEEDAISPRRMLNLAIGLVLGMMLSVGGVFAVEMLDTSIKSRKQVERLGLPLLGTIPKVKNHDPKNGRLMVAGADATDAVAAAYVRVESNLRLANLDSQPQVIVTTSAIPGEGKSTTSLNFSYTLAQSGQKVILIDGDLRRPVLHRSLNEPRSPGLTEVVSDQVDVEDAIRTVQIEGQQLDIITAGVRPPSVVNTFRSKAFKEMIARLRKDYDWVLIDLPPVIVGSEAMEVAVQSDGALLIIEAGKTPLNALEEAMAQLQQANVPILGAVLNQYDPKKAGDTQNYGSYYSDDDGVS